MSFWSRENLIKRLVIQHVINLLEICHEKSATRNSIVQQPVSCPLARRSPKRRQRFQ